MELIVGDEVSRNFPIQIGGYDRAGRLILFLNAGPGLWDIKGFLEKGIGSREEFIQHVVSKFKEVDLLIHEPGQDSGVVPEYVVMGDLGGVSFRQVMSPKCISTVIDLASKIDKENSEACKAFYGVNAPRYMKILFDAMKPFLSKESGSKINLFDSNRKKWSQILSEAFHFDQLPETLRRQM